MAAPGDGSHDVTCSTSADNAYRNGFGGTSGATPKVAGTAALMLELNPRLSHADVRDILNRTGSMVITDPGTPVGNFLNAGRAVQEASSTTPFTSNISPGACNGPAFRLLLLSRPGDKY